MLQWQHLWSDHFEHISELIREGSPLPPAFDDQPDLLPIAEFYWQAFNELSSSRSMGMGLGPIPYTAIAEFARFNGIRDPDDFATLRAIVCDVDAAYLKINQPKNQSDEN